jgi:hypothetical protein
MAKNGGRIMGLKRWLQKKEGPHVGPSVWHDIYPRIGAAVLTIVAWLWLSNLLLGTADHSTLATIQFWGSVIFGGLVFFGAGENGFGN